MFAAETYEWRPRTPPLESLRAACWLLLMPLIVTALTAGFLGYAAWRLARLFWQLPRLTWRAVRGRQIARASARLT
jgi:hypothetical protein